LTHPPSIGIAQRDHQTVLALFALKQGVFALDNNRIMLHKGLIVTETPAGITGGISSALLR